MTTIRDPVHGDIELTPDELRLIDTPEFQRLRGIKQLGAASLVYPGATHTRFEHSIGTLHMTELLVRAVNRNAERDPSTCRPISADERRVLRAAALLHDVTHVPHGHNIEDQTGLLPRHDSPERFRSVLGDTALGDELARQNLRGPVLDALADGDLPAPSFRQQIVSDTIDADLLDYLSRDAHYTGLELRYDRRVVDYFRVDARTERLFVDCEKHGMLREDIVSEMLRVLEMRYHFSERVYYHHAKVAAGALIARMVEMAMRAGALSARELQTATDESLILSLENADLGSAEDNERLRRFTERFRRRSLPKRVLVLPEYLNRPVQKELLRTCFDPERQEARRAWERDVEDSASKLLGRPTDVILYCPARSMQLKEARTLVRFPGSGQNTVQLDAFQQEIPRLAELRRSYPRLWKLYVFSSEPDPEARRRLQDLCLESLPKGCVNALRLA
ncbi:MAG: hypothetical protein Fur0037_14440 [Planctomycetota bacterium]